VDAVTRRKALARCKRATHCKWVMLMPMPSRQNAPGNLLKLHASSRKAQAS